MISGDSMVNILYFKFLESEDQIFSIESFDKFYYLLKLILLSVYYYFG